MRSGRFKISYLLREQVRVVCRLARKVTVRWSSIRKFARG